MRLFQKSGVWKNHEDEVLKAAVMKYGKNQWSRIASLLPKKTAKEAKERWNSWLDPTIKKTEWTKEEEEKLLYLAKVMPSKWRSIAPIVGRTPHQCLTHYNELLDQAMEKEGEFDPSEDPLKMRPGVEADLNPAQKAPMPDGDDMSDDEKEMLNEARARLSNTQGKKAKRKARGKQIEEARRLAAVQKRREHRAAGIDGASHMRKKKRGIDYSTEIPFFKAPPPGVFDTSEELQLRRQDDSTFQNLDIHKAEGELRAKKEADARREDKSKQLKKKQQDLAGHFEQLNKKVDPSSTVRRQALSLPETQVTENDLRSLQKMSGAADHAEVSRQTRTERTVQQEDVLQIEAQNQARMRVMETPLLDGGETPMVQRTSRGLAGTMGDTPSAAVQATPNVYALRAKDAAKEQRAVQRITTAAAVRGLDNLPKPKNRVALVVNMTDEQKALLAEKGEEGEAAGAEAVSSTNRLDATDTTQVKKRKRTGALMSRPTSAVSRGLPRPAALAPSAPAGGDAQGDAQRLVEEELRKLIAYDATVHPMSGKPGRNKVQLQDFTEAQLASAAAEVVREEARLKGASPFFKRADGCAPRVVDGFALADPEAVISEMELAADDTVFVPNPSRMLSKRQCSTAERLASLKHEFDVLRNHTARRADAASKLEKKAGMYTNGYLTRLNELTEQLHEKRDTLQDARIQYNSYQEMWALEEVAIKERTRVAKERLQQQKGQEATLQATYARLAAEKSRLQEKQAAKRQREEDMQAEMDALAELEAEIPATKRSRAE